MIIHVYGQSRFSELFHEDPEAAIAEDPENEPTEAWPSVKGLKGTDNNNNNNNNNN